MIVEAVVLLMTITTWKNVAACSHYNDAACIVTDPLEGRHFLNQWIVNIEGGPRKARNVARELGFEYMKKMRTHDDHYFFRHPTDVPHRHKMRHKDILEKLKSHNDIISSDQQYVFELTLNEIDNFEDMVGHSEPLSVKITHFNSDGEPIEKDESDFLYSEEKRKREDIEIVYADDEESNSRLKDDENKLSSLDQKIDLDVDYARERREIEKLEQKVDKVLEKLKNFE